MINQITIRVVNKTTGKVKNVFPSIANNKQLMKTSGMEISDPQYDAKMEAFRNNRPFIENGKSKEPVKESFATDLKGYYDSCNPSQEVPIIKFDFDKNKSCCNSDSKCTEDEKIEISTRNQSGEQLISNEKPKRTRRTKEQMKQSKLQK